MDRRELKILHICSRVPYPLNDGGAIAMFNMAKGFQELGADLTLFCFNTSKHFLAEEDFPAELTELGKIITVPVYNHITAWGAFRNLFTRESYHMERFEDPGIEKRLLEEVRGQTYDVIQFDGIQTSMYVDRVKEASPQSLCVLRQHNVEYLLWERIADETSAVKKPYMSLLARRLRKYETEIIKRFDAVVPISEVDKNVFAEHGVTEQFVSPTGVDVGRWPADQSLAEPLSLFHLGALNWIPNQEGIRWFVQEVWPLVKEKYPSLKFYIAGRDIPDWINAYHGQNEIIVLGEVPSAADYLNEKWLMVVPLRSGSGMRIKVLEGMAMAKPIVSTTIGVEGIPVEDGVHVQIADDVEGFVQKIGVLLGDPTIWQDLGRNARLLVEEKFSNRARISQLMDYYAGLLEPTTT